MERGHNWTGAHLPLESNVRSRSPFSPLSAAFATLWPNMPVTGHGLKLTAGIALVAAGLAACSPTISQRGYVPNEDLLAEIRPGIDNKDSVLSTFGSPSTISSVEGNSWYYISSIHEQLAFYREEAVDREIVAVYFDENGNVEQLGYYGLEDGKIVNFISRETPTRGKELTFLQQMFGNLGRFGGATRADPTPGL